MHILWCNDFAETSLITSLDGGISCLHPWHPGLFPLDSLFYFPTVHIYCLFIYCLLFYLYSSISFRLFLLHSPLFLYLTYVLCLPFLVYISPFFVESFLSVYIFYSDLVVYKRFPTRLHGW